MTPRTDLRLVALALALLALTACSDQPAPAGMPPTAVKTVVLQPGPASVVSELPGRLTPTRIAEVRARVQGVVLERSFVEGSVVEAGDLLFQIDPAPLQADLDAAAAALARAEAEAAQAAASAARSARLVASGVVSQQEHELAQAAELQSRAAVQAAAAQLRRARIQLGYARVEAPIAGHVGRALVTEGALVGLADATPMARIQQIDPIHADFTQSTAELAALRRAFADGTLQQVDEAAARIELVLEDGSIYPRPGRLLFSDISVDPGTGQVLLRGEFPNPEGELLPGSYVRVRLELASRPDALRVPKQAVQRNAGGQTYVTVVERSADGQGAVAAQRNVRVGSSLGTDWLIEEGLQPGDEVIVEGFQRARPGAPLSVQRAP